MSVRCTASFRRVLVLCLLLMVVINTVLLLLSDRHGGVAGRRARASHKRPVKVRTTAAAPHQRRLPAATSRPARTAATTVVLLSYVGAGGGAAAELLNLLPAVSHHHEPLAPLDEEGRHSGIEPLVASTLTKGLSLLEDTMRCNLTAHVTELRDDDLWKMHAFRTVFRSQCVPSNVSIAACLERVCKKSRTVSIKLIRTFFHDIRPILHRWKGRIKVVIVQRDPRAILLTRRRRGVGLPLKKEVDFFHAARSLCSRMLQDVELSDEHEPFDPGFHRVLLYEHLVEHPARVARLLYDFLGFNVTREQLQHVLQQAGLDSPSPERARAWRSEVTEAEVRAADKGCSHFYDASMYDALRGASDLKDGGDFHGGIPQVGSEVL